MKKIAFLFPGQGAQYPGMGLELSQEYDIARQTFEEADDVLGFKLSEIIFYGSKEDLKKTEVTQPAILTVSIACTRVLNGMGIEAAGAAGLSLGEYSALVTGNSLKFEDALPLVKKRGKYMQEAVPEGEGKMLAVLGLETEKIEAVCDEIREETENIVRPVNYNCPGQVVIAGDSLAVDKAGARCKEENAKRAVELPVSAPFHCEMLKPAGDKLEEELKKIEFKPPDIKIISNVTGDLMEAPEQIKRMLTLQVRSPVLWEQSIRKFLDLGFENFIELPPGATLTGFMKKIEKKKVVCKAIDKVENLEQLRKEF